MDTTAIAVVANEEALGLPSGPMSDSEKRDRDNQHHKIKACSEGIGAALSHIYNNRLFRGDDGEQSWKDYVNGELPQWLGESPSVDSADQIRALHEAQILIPRCGTAPRCLPSRITQAKELFALIPRREVRHPETGGVWYPANLDDPDAAQGIAKVWELACQNAERNQRRNGPTAEDVRAAREELRPALEQQGLIRSAPASFQAATAARVEAARQRTIDVTVNRGGRAERYEDAEHEAQVRRDYGNDSSFRQTMAQIRDTKAERQASVDADEVRQQLDQSEQQRISLLQQEVRAYNQHLTATASAIHALKVYMDTLSRVHGTQILDDLREVTVLGLISVADDMDRLQSMGQELVDVAKLARTSAPPTGINMETIEV